MGEDSPYYVPARSIEAIKLAEILDATRINKETSMLESRYLSKPAVDNISENIDEAIHGALGELTLKDLVLNKIDTQS